MSKEMACGSYLSIIQGDDYEFSTNVTVDNVAQNVTGASISLYAITSLDWEDPEILFNANTNTAQVSINNATITVSMNSAFTNNIPLASVGHWFLRANTAAGKVYTLDRGRLCVVAGHPAIPL
jgi:hypothetical protein